MEIPTTADYLDRIIADSLTNNRSIRYDTDIAKALDLTKTSLSMYRHGHNMSVTVALKIAEILRIHPMETISATMARQSTKEADRKAWEYYYEKYKDQKGSSEDRSTNEST
jgi:predicted transcriptional regulator